MADNDDGNDPNKKVDPDGQNKDGGDGGIDPTIKALQDDPDGIARILKAKRSANAEAAELRKKLEAFESAKTDAEKKALEDQGKFKELADLSAATLKTVTEKFKLRAVLSALTIEAIKAGITDPDLVKLIDLSAAEVDDDFGVKNAAEIVVAFKEAKPDFFADANDGNDSRDFNAPDGKKPPLKTVLRGGDWKDLNRHSKVAIGLEQQSKKR